MMTNRISEGYTPLDFIIIGAQKSATTSIYKYLQDHPMIDMPKLKEAPFFNQEHLSTEMLEAFNAEHFQTPKGNLLRGKASPQYMSSPDIPKRIFDLMPQVKLIAILRDPVSRSFSHYRMVRRRGTEERDFSEIVESQLSSHEQIELCSARKNSAPMHSQGYVSESEFLIAWSEYGRILEQYFLQFPAEQILVLFADNLKQNPQQVVQQIMAFLGLNTDYLPSGLGEVFHQGGDAQWLSDTARSSLVNTPLIRQIWDKTPEGLKQELRYWFEQRNIRKGATNVSIDTNSEAVLRQHFSADIQKLSQHVSLPASWLEKYS